MDEGFFTKLLSSKETFYATEKGKVLTTVDEKLEEVYKKVFATKQHDETSISIHEYNQIKNTLLRTAGLLSPYTDIDIE